MRQETDMAREPETHYKRSKKMRRTVITLAAMVLSGLLVVSTGYGERVLVEPFETITEGTWVCSGTPENGPDPATLILETDSNGCSYYHNTEDWPVGQIETEATYPAAEGTVMEFDVKVDSKSNESWAIVGIANKPDVKLESGDFYTVIYIAGVQGYVCTGSDYWKEFTLLADTWLTLRIEVVSGGYVDLYINNVKACRTEQAIAALEGKPDGKVLLYGNQVMLDNLLVGTSPNDVEFRDDFDGPTLGSDWSTLASPDAYVTHAAGIPAGAFYTWSPDFYENFAVTKWGFQAMAGITITFDALVPENDGALVAVGVTVGQPVIENVRTYLLLNNSTGMVEYMLDSDQYDQANAFDHEWHTYTIEISKHLTSVYQDGYEIASKQTTQAPETMQVFILAKDAYIDNLRIK